MYDQLLTNIEPVEMIEGCKGRFVHLERFTLAFWEIEAGTEIPMHSHEHEQSCQVTEGEFELTVGETTKVYSPGMIVSIPSNVPHGGKAITSCKITDTFCPVREDYKF